MQSATASLSLKELEEKLKEFFSGVNDVTVAYLFGSTARGEANSLSDIDIAVLFEDKLLQEAFDPHLELNSELTGHCLTQTR
jgi:predicted nucleotidyltransferase